MRSRVRYAETTTPGAVVLVRQGDTEYLAAYGTREYGGGDPVTVDDYFRIGSNTKTMTGTVILQLVDGDELALDDPVSDFVPDVPNGENITIAQLLDMRSGLHSYSELISFNRILDEEPQKVWCPTSWWPWASPRSRTFRPATATTTRTPTRCSSA